MKLRIACAVVAVTAVCLSAWNFSSGQGSGGSGFKPADRGVDARGDADADADTLLAPAEEMTPVLRSRPYGSGSPVGGFGYGYAFTRGSAAGPLDEAQSTTQQAVEKYRNAEDEEGKEEAKQAMSTALSEYFDADMELREEEIRDIEERVKKLQAQLERRREAKAKLVELQLQVLVNEAEGLGFYGPSGVLRSAGRGGRAGMGRPAGIILRTPPSAPDTPPPPSR